VGDDDLHDALVRARTLLVDLERHLDRGDAERDLAEIGRAWVRAAQVERILRSVLPADVTAEVPDVGDPLPDADARPVDKSKDSTRRRRD
jgi:hypothetical protein